MAVIAFTNQKGGVGKTTTAVNVAAEFAKQGFPTLLIDLDPQGNAGSGLGIRPDKHEAAAYDLLIDAAPLADVVRESAVDGLDVVPGGQALAGAEVELAGTEGRYVRLARALHQHHYRYVIIDCPPSLGFLSLNAIVAARYAIIPVQGEYYALEGLSALTDILRKVRGSLNPELDLLGVVVTMYDKRLKLAAEVTGELEKHFPNHIFQTRIPRTVRLAEAPSFGEPISMFDKWSRGARAYASLAQEVHHAVEARARQRA